MKTVYHINCYRWNSVKVEYRMIQKRNTSSSKKGIQGDPKMEYKFIQKGNTA